MDDKTYKELKEETLQLVAEIKELLYPLATLTQFGKGEFTGEQYHYMAALTKNGGRIDGLVELYEKLNVVGADETTTTTLKIELIVSAIKRIIEVEGDNLNTIDIVETKYNKEVSG